MSGVSRPTRGLDTAAGHGHRAACSASGQQGPAGRHERGRERLEQLLERAAAVGLTGHERPVDGGQREPRELLGDRALRIVAERGRDPFPQELERVLAYPADDSLYLPLTRGGGLRGEDDQQPEEVRVALERADGSRHHPGQVLRGTPGPPVLIVGGGGAGLTSSMLLARLGVEHLLVSARPQTSDLPKAHVLNQRAMEVLDDAGVAGAIAERSTPPEQMAATAFYAGFAGPSPDHGRRLARLECWGAGGADDSWRATSPWRQLNLPQIRLEPLLKARAEELSPARIRFGHELTGLDQDGDGGQATIRDNASGRHYVVRCQYLLGADGGRRVAGLTGVGYEGLGVVTQTATLHVSADFSPWARDPDFLIRWIYSPQAGVLVVMVPMGPQRWGPASEEWVIHLNYLAGDPRAQSDAQVEADARQALGVPDLPVKIHKITRWSVEAVMASSFRAGRVFLLGDAAHRHPPTGGLGLTSAIHDAQNLCWKLALVLAGHASPALLDTYQAERRPVDERNAQRSLENAASHFAIGAALGISHENTPGQNMEQLRRMWSGRPGDAAHRSAVLRAMRAQSMEFSELNVEYGYSYQSAASCPTAAPRPPRPTTSACISRPPARVPPAARLDR